MVEVPRGLPYRWTVDYGEDEQGVWVAFAVAGVSYGLRWIPPGTFQMGSPVSEVERWDDETLHRVTLSQGFWLGATVVTQALWQMVMGTNPSQVKGEQLPVESVSWHDAQAFIKRLNLLIPGLALRLPTEAEWEYACRAGTTTAFHFGPTITTAQANFDGDYRNAGGTPGEARGATVAVTDLLMNAWGLYQMHGNVREWCSDWSGPYGGDAVNPQGPQQGTRRVLRGGSWFVSAGNARSAYRGAIKPDERDNHLGFRLARSAD